MIEELKKKITELTQKHSNEDMTDVLTPEQP